MMEGKRFNPYPLPWRRRYHHIPPCGGLHTQAAEQYCYECRDLQYQRDILNEMRRANELKELQLELAPQERRESRYIPPHPVQPKPKIERRGA